MDKFIIGVVIIGITLVIGMFIASTMQDAIRDTSTAGAYVNESATPTDAGITLAANSLNDGTCGTITTVFNATGGMSISSGNYTQSGCTLTNSTSEYPDAWLVSYPYSYSADNAASNASGDLVTSLAGGSAWITILIVVGFATIVLGMLTQGLGKSAELEAKYTY